MSLSDDEVRVLHTHVYSKPTEILAELKRRREDVPLRKKVQEFLAGNTPQPLDGETVFGVFSRPIFTPNLELAYFYETANLMGLPHALLQYGGKFVAKNPEKYHLCKLHFFAKPGKRGGINYTTTNIVDFNAYEGKPMEAVPTLWGEPLVDFHKGLLLQKFPTLKNSVFDFSSWFNKTRTLTPHYYFYYFALFLTHGVLFENFLTDDEEENVYIKQHVLPGFMAVEQYFGVKPLIYPLLPIEHEKARTWLSYPTDVHSYFNKRV